MTAMPGEGAPTTPNNNATNGGFEDVAPKKSPDRLGRRILATSVALASMISAGCSDKDSNNKESRNSYDSGKPTATEFVPDKTSSDGSSNAIIETDDIIVTETQKNTSNLPKIIEANPEQGQNCPVYGPKNTIIEPAIDVDDYMLSEAPGGAPKSPNGYIDITKVCKDLGISDSEITTLGDELLIGSGKDGVAIKITSGYNFQYLVDGKMVCKYNTDDGSAFLEDGVSFYVWNEADSKYEFGAQSHYSSSTFGVLEVMLRAKAENKTTDPLAI